MPGADGDIETESYVSAKAFRDTFHGFRFTNPKTGITFGAADLPKNHVDPTTIYIAKHPFLKAQLKESSYNQVVDKAFEGEACAAIEHHLQSHSIWCRAPHDSNQPDSWRFLTGAKDVAEWEGIWESSNGHVYFLEAKHFMSHAKYPQIRNKLRRSLDFLHLDPSKATVYIAGNHWSYMAMEDGLNLYKFGVLTSNGKDLDVRDPPPA
ncbi:hypothetical protein PILCRDRAFT_3562 [Piloderma croceum F 1598]|uniref:Uncharacterized protein n=1 Tax=Piloderma croceum (strain F 1598) TaxID=765440 RepID=A0A0C3BMX0_PILCF|nr:hypothetical protein PILCRDRAFT_3562 [Piloderma croceum F 1598]